MQFSAFSNKANKPDATVAFSHLNLHLRTSRLDPIIAIIRIGEWLITGETMNFPEGDGLFSEFLSLREQHRLSTLHHLRRRKEWLASRLAAKYLFLTQIGRTPANTRRWQDWGPWFQVILPGHLRCYSPQEYRQIEILPMSPNRRTPQLIWMDQDMSNSLSVSISHAGGWATAILSTNGPIGIDMEVIAPQTHSFLRESFSEAERSWAYLNSQVIKVSTDWLYTLLWTLKEAFFKAGLVREWHPKKIEITLPSPISEILRTHKIGPFKHILGPLYLQNKTKLPQTYQATCVSTNEWILTAIIYKEETQNGEPFNRDSADLYESYSLSF